MHKLEIVLVAPQIPQNTGNIGRLCVNTSTTLHLIEPLGFSLDEKYIRRSGMDYWKYLNLKVYDDWNAFVKEKSREDLYFFSTKTDRVFWDADYAENSRKRTQYLVFGNEGSGLPVDFYIKYSDRLYTIPMFGEHSRSYNLANSVSIVLFEGFRRIYPI